MWSIVAVIFLCVLGVLWKVKPTSSIKKSASKNQQQQLAVNYHFTRQCNYNCGFCFHTAKTSFVLGLDEAKAGLQLLHEYGIKKINFAGGEPFLEPKKLGEMAKFCKETLQMESVSIVSNGSKLTAKWFEQYGQYIDILAISVDSFDESINVKIGRGKGNHLKNVEQAKYLCGEHGIKFKINTVVNQYNHLEDLNEEIARLNPCRWKVFQVLELKGENDGDADSKRDVKPFLITDEQFKGFISRHKEQKSLVVEDNTQMRSSYLLLDEYMRFLDCSTGGKVPSKSILDVGVAEAMKDSGFDKDMFESRGGIYEWSRQRDSSCGDQTTLCNSKDLEW